MSKLLKFLSAVISYVAVATLITQLVLMGVFATAGYLTKDKFYGALAVFYGIPPVATESDERFRGDGSANSTLHEAIQVRSISSLDLDLREQAIERGLSELLGLQQGVQERIARHEKMKTSFEAELSSLKQEAQDESLNKLQEILELMKPKQAKEQILKMLDDDAMGDVVTIMKKMAPDKQKKVMAEFDKGDNKVEDTEKLSEILREIRRGAPEHKLINQAQIKLEKSVKESI